MCSMVDPARGLPHMQVHSYSEFLSENGRVVMNDAGTRITPKQNNSGVI